MNEVKEVVFLKQSKDKNPQMNQSKESRPTQKPIIKNKPFEFQGLTKKINDGINEINTELKAFLKQSKNKNPELIEGIHQYEAKPISKTTRKTSPFDKPLKLNQVKRRV